MGGKTLVILVLPVHWRNFVFLVKKKEKLAMFLAPFFVIMVITTKTAELKTR